MIVAFERRISDHRAESLELEIPQDRSERGDADQRPRKRAMIKFACRHPNCR